MQCSEFEIRCHELLDERLLPEHDLRLVRHAAHCPECRELLAAQQSLFQCLPRAASMPRDPEFSARVVAAVASDACPPRLSPVKRGWRLAPIGLLAAAAAALLAVSLAWQARLPSVSLAGQQRGRPARVIGPAKTGGLLGVFQPGAAKRAASTVPALPDGNTSRGHHEPAQSAAGYASYRGAIDELALGWPAAASQLDELERIAPGIRPLRQSLTMFWETFCRAVSGVAAESTAGEPRDTSRWSLEPGRVA